MRQLLLMRHAKSDWGADYGSDHERPLNDRGVRSARLMGRLLSDVGMAPELVISSTAVRARTTAELAAQAGGWVAQLRLERDLYDGGPDGVISVAAQTGDVGRLMLVGHQPTWSLLVRSLSGEDEQMKTASVAVVHLEIPDWSQLPGARGRLAALHHPRDYFGGEFDQL